MSIMRNLTKAEVLEMSNSDDTSALLLQSKLESFKTQYMTARQITDIFLKQNNGDESWPEGIAGVQKQIEQIEYKKLKKMAETGDNQPLVSNLKHYLEPLKTETAKQILDKLIEMSGDKTDEESHKIFCLNTSIMTVKDYERLKEG